MRPMMTLIDRIKNLHLLLRVPSFTRWPLQVRFFCRDVYDKWQRWNKDVDRTIRNGIKVILDIQKSHDVQDNEEVRMNKRKKGKRKREAMGNGGVTGLDVGYSDIMDHVKKSMFLLDDDERISCAYCLKEIGADHATALVCPEKTCQAVSHMACLAKAFLANDCLDTVLLPTSGACPRCNAANLWIDLVKDMTLRARGQTEVSQLLNKSQMKNGEKAIPKNEIPLISQKLGLEQDTDLDGDSPDGALADDPLPEDWQYQGEDDDAESMTSIASETSDAMDTKFSPQTLNAVIEDSDWDDAKMLD